MKPNITPPADDQAIRCRRLGNPVPFSYCRKENKGLPCFKTLDCWFEFFGVEEYLQAELSPEEWKQVFGRPVKQKTLSLVELIEEAKKTRSEE